MRKAKSHPPVTFDDHAAYTDTHRREILLKLRRKIFDYDDQVEEKATPGQRIAYKIAGDKIFAEIKVLRSAIVLD